MYVEHVRRMEMSVMNENTRRLERKMQKLRMPLVGSILFHHITASLPILNEYDNHQCEKNQ